MKNAEALEAFRFASTQNLKDAYMAGDLTEQQTRSLLSLKEGLTHKHMLSLVRDWKSMKQFLAEEGR